MKKMLSALFVLFLALNLSAQNKKWVYDGAFPDTTVLKDVNSLHGVAVDPEGKVWLQDYYVSTKDTVFPIIGGVPTPYTVRVLKIFKADGTPASFSPMKFITVGGVTDTLGGATVNGAWSANTGRGMSVGPDGNIYASYFGMIYKINYKTGAGMMKIVVDNVNSITRAAVDSVGNIFVANVAPGYAMRMYSATGTAIGNAIDATVGFSRGFEVSNDGNTIFWAGYSTNKVMIWNRPDDFTPYSVKDSIVGMTAEAMCRDPKDKNYIWVCAGPADNPPTDPAYTSHTFYKVNVKTKAITDSIHYAGLDATSDAKHRGLWFTQNADTCYLTAWPVTAALLTAPKVVRMVLKTVGLDKVNMVANDYALEQNYPNPFNPSTEIRFAVAQDGNVNLKVYDIVGNEVAVLANGFMQKGTYTTQFDASKLSSGTYFYRLSVNGVTLTKKMMFVK